MLMGFYRFSYISCLMAASRMQILHDELEGLEQSAQRAFDINALEGTVFDVSRTSLLVAVGRKQSEALDAVGPRGMWRCDKHIPQTTVERQIHVRGRCCTGAENTTGVLSA